MGVLKIKQSKYDSHEERWTLERPEFAQAAHSFLIQKQGYEMKKKKKWQGIKLAESYALGCGFIAPTIALHQRHFQSCRRKTLPQVLSQTAHLALTGKLPSNHWWGIAICEEVVTKVKYSEIEIAGFCVSITGGF